MRNIVAVAFILLAFPAFPAFAADTTVDLTSPVQDLLAIVGSIVLSLGFVVALWLAAILKKRTGIDLEKSIRELEALHRTTLQSAVSTWVAAAAQKYGPNLRLEIGSPAIGYIMNGIAKSAPDAVKALKPSEEWVTAYVARVLGVTVSAPT